jgi:hypothetical protein
MKNQKSGARQKRQSFRTVGAQPASPILRPASNHVRMKCGISKGISNESSIKPA